jgi:hypothetical protein
MEGSHIVLMVVLVGVSQIFLVVVPGEELLHMGCSSRLLQLVDFKVAVPKDSDLTAMAFRVFKAEEELPTSCCSGPELEFLAWEIPIQMGSIPEEKI